LGKLCKFNESKGLNDFGGAETEAEKLSGHA
jgi:hypothetical protein